MGATLGMDLHLLAAKVHLNVEGDVLGPNFGKSPPGGRGLPLLLQDVHFTLKLALS